VPLTISCLAINIGGYGASEEAGVEAEASYAYQQNDYYYYPYGSISVPKVAGLWSLSSPTSSTASDGDSFEYL